ncbi:hypothetical protein WJX82_001050 [Trebouxia sp. C0006]
MQEDHAVCSDDASAEQHPEASGKLLSGVPKRETPIVAFVNTSKIPRATRQQVLQKLAGQHLTMALMDAECELIPDQVAARDDLRKVALKAAIDQELKLFKSCMSKASYLNAAARTDASLVKFPPASMQPLPQPKAYTSAQQTPGSMALNSEGAGTSRAAGIPAKAIEAAAAAEAASEAYHQPDLVSDYQAGSQGNSDKGLVQHAVAEYVRALLDPFYKAGIVDREMYKLVIKKAVAKILQNHISAEDTDFLIQESEQIQKLVREYIRYAQKKLHK